MNNSFEKFKTYGNKIFLVFEWRYNQLGALLADKNYKQPIMGEIIWFYSLIQHLR